MCHFCLPFVLESGHDEIADSPLWYNMYKQCSWPAPVHAVHPSNKLYCSCQIKPEPPILVRYMKPMTTSLLSACCVLYARLSSQVIIINPICIFRFMTRYLQSKKKYVCEWGWLCGCMSILFLSMSVCAHESLVCASSCSWWLSWQCAEHGVRSSLQTGVLTDQHLYQAIAKEHEQLLQQQPQACLTGAPSPLCLRTPSTIKLFDAQSMVWAKADAAIVQQKPFQAFYAHCYICLCIR